MSVVCNGVNRMNVYSRMEAVGWILVRRRTPIGTNFVSATRYEQPAFLTASNVSYAR